MAALRPANNRKVILATNIAETSLTIDGVTVVIDSGFARVAAFDPRRGLDRLELKKISQASAAQRAGRAGRTAPGRCVRLWSQKEQADLKEFELPEVKRVDLCSAVLDFHAWGKPDPRKFDWFDTPPEESLAGAERLLESSGALREGKLTSIGKKLIRLPVHPRVGRLLIAAAKAGCADQGANLAALLSERTLPPPMTDVHADSDLLIRLRAIHPGQTAQARNELRRLRKQISDAPAKRASEETLLKLALRLSRSRLPPPRRKFHRRGDRRRGRSAIIARIGGSQIGILSALDLRHDPRSATREATVWIASAIRSEWLEEMFPESIVRERRYAFDEQKEMVTCTRVTRYLDLTMDERRDSAVDPQRAGEVLAAALRPRAAEVLASDERTKAVLNRVAFLRRWMPEQAWPKFDQEELADILCERCEGVKSVKDLKTASLADALLARLQYPLDRMLDREAPEAIVVPSGSRIEIAYAADGPPVLAVRLQEIFGWTQTPRVAGGRAPLLLHLLGPNFRPVQITDDLTSFWSTTYFQVRKDLRVRYPKHSWPEDPLTAQPQAKGRRR